MEKRLRMTERMVWPRNGTGLGRSDPTFAHGAVSKLSRGSLQLNKTQL